MTITIFQKQPLFRCRRRARGCRGLTMLELLLALASTAVLLGAVASMMFAFTSTLDVDRDAHANHVRAHLAHSRTADAIRQSRMVLAYGDAFVVLWRADGRQSGEPNLSEIQRIEWHESEGTLAMYQARDDLGEAEDTTHDLGTTDFDTLTQSMIATGTFVQTIWMEDVDVWRLWADHAEAYEVRLVCYQMHVASEEPSLVERITSAALHDRE